MKFIVEGDTNVRTADPSLTRRRYAITGPNGAGKYDAHEDPDR